MYVEVSLGKMVNPCHMPLGWHVKNMFVYAAFIVKSIFMLNKHKKKDYDIVLLILHINQ